MKLAKLLHYFKSQEVFRKKCAVNRESGGLMFDKESVTVEGIKKEVDYQGLIGSILYTTLVVHRDNTLQTLVPTHITKNIDLIYE